MKQPIPRPVRLWLFLYGLFFGLVIGGTLGLMGITISESWFVLIFLVGFTLLTIMFLDWKYEKTIEKWLPSEYTSVLDLLRRILQYFNIIEGKKKQ